MFTKYVKAMQEAKYDSMEDGTFFGEIAGFPGRLGQCSNPGRLQG